MAKLKSYTFYRRRPQSPSWTDDPVRDEMAWQEYLEESNDYDDEMTADEYWADAREDDWR